MVKAAGLGDLPMDLSTMPPSSGSSASAFFPSFNNLLNQLDSFDRQQTAPQTAEVSQPVMDAPQEITLPGSDQQQNTDTINAPAPATNNDQVVTVPVVSFPAATEQAPIPASAIVSGETNMPAASVVVPTPETVSEPAPAPVSAPTSPPQPPAPAPTPPSNQPVSIALDSPAPATPATVQAAPVDTTVTNPVDAPTTPPPAPNVVETPAPSTEKTKETAQETRPPLSKPAPPPSTSRIGFGNPTNYMDTPENGGGGGGVLSATDSKSTGGLSAYAYAGIVLAGVVAGVILLVFARKVNRRRRDRHVQHEQDAEVFEQAKAAYSSHNEPSREEMMTMTAIMQEATPKPEKIGSQRTSLMAWAKGGRKKKTERFEDLVSTFGPETNNAYAQPHVSTIYEDVDSEDEDEDEEALRNVIVDHNRQGGATISAKLTAMMSNKSTPKYAGTVNRRYSEVPVLQPGQMSTMMGQTAPTASKKRQSMQQTQPSSGYNVINLSNSKLPKLASVKEYTSANALEEMVNENRTRIQKANAGGTFANFAARPTSMFNSLESMTSPTPKHRWSLANTLEDAADRMVKTYSTDSSPALSIKMPIAKHSIAISKKFDAHQSQESLVSSIDIPPAVTAHSSNHSLTVALRAQASRISLPDTVDSSSEGRTSLGSHSSKRVHTSMNAMQAAVGGKIPSNTLVAPPMTYAPSEAGDSVSHGSDGYLDFDIHRMRRAESPSSNGNHLWSNRHGLVE